MTQRTGSFSIAREGASEEATYTATLRGAAWELVVEAASFGTVTTSAGDVFEASLVLREQLEPSGYRFMIAGARSNAWPSGMSREMGGLRVYLLEVERIRAREALEFVGTFDPAELNTIGTVEQQRTIADSLLAGRTS